MLIRRLILVALVVCAVALTASAAVPPMINYQGKLMQPSGVPVPDNTYSMTFAIYGVPTGGTALWSETNPSVQVKGGLFSVLLGSVTNLPANIFDNENRWFGVTVGTDPEMTPRQKIASVAFAQKAASADIATTVPDGAITTGKLAELSVTGAKIANESVDAAKIAPNAVTADKIADGNVSTAKIAAGAVDATRLSAGAITLGYAEITSTFAPPPINGDVDVEGLSLTVTVPTGGRRIRITAYSVGVSTTPAVGAYMVTVKIKEGSTTLQAADSSVGDNRRVPFNVSYVSNIPPAPGLHTYKVSVYNAGAGYITFGAGTSDPAFILVEAI